MILEYWVSPDGEVIEIDNHPVKKIVEEPVRYGYSLDELKMIYAKYNDQNEMEGEATKAVIRDMLAKGWIYAHRKSNKNDWHLSVERLDKRTRFNIQNWAQNVISVGYDSEDSHLRIHRYSKDLKAKKTFKEILEGDFF